MRQHRTSSVSPIYTENVTVDVSREGFAAPVVNSGESKVIDTGPYECVQKIFDPFFTTRPAAMGWDWRFPERCSLLRFVADPDPALVRLYDGS